jgi:hypothetical protein
MSNKSGEPEMHDCAKLLHAELGKYLSPKIIDMITSRSRCHASVVWQGDKSFYLEIWYPCCADCKTQPNATIQLTIGDAVKLGPDPLQEIRNRSLLEDGKWTEQLELHFLNPSGKCTVLSKPDEFWIDLPDGRTGSFRGKAADGMWDHVLDHLPFCKPV